MNGFCAYKAEYEAAEGKELTNEYIKEEIAADLMMDVMGNEELTAMFAQKSTKEDLNFIARFFRRFVDAIKKVFGGNKKYQQYVYDAEKLLGVFERAIKADGNKKISGVAETRYGLTDADLPEYIATGKTLHTRHKKEAMLQQGKKPILTTEKEIKTYLSDVIHGNAPGEVRAFGRVSKRLSDAIAKLRGSLVLEGSFLEFQSDGLREAYKRHSSPKIKGNIPLSESDFENLHHHIWNFDGVLSVNDYHGKTEIHIYKKSDDGYYQIITVSSSERNSLQVTKIIGVSSEMFERKYAKKIDNNTGSPRGQEASIPSTKARHTAGVMSKDSIPHSDENVNTKSAISSKPAVTSMPANENSVFDDKQRKDVIRKLSAVAKQNGVARLDKDSFVTDAMGILEGALQTGIVSDGVVDELARCLYDYSREDAGDADLAGTYKDIRERINKVGKIYVPESVKNDIPDYYGLFSYRRGLRYCFRYFGKLRNFFLGLESIVNNCLCSIGRNICALVQVLSGEKVVAEVPVISPSVLTVAGTSLYCTHSTVVMYFTTARATLRSPVLLK